ncbi:DUF1972 domain-containing protein [Escherichia coli]|nr:DUF1972 domain-containing protein [Escherichia coli]
MKKISVIGIVGLPAAYGGFETLVENLTKNASSDIHYEVFCSSRQHSSKLKKYNGAVLRYVPLKANGIQSIFYDIFSVFRSLTSKPDVILVLGVSGAVVLPIVKLFSRAKIITNIDGLEWKRDKWRKLARCFLKFSEFLAVKYSDVVITDNQAISDYVLEEYGNTSSVIAYGGDHSLITSAVNLPKYSAPFYLTICRIEPENNIHIILEAFSQTNHNLKLIGNWHSSIYGKELFENYSRFSNIELIHPIYELEKLYVLRETCCGYIHGHSAGGTNPSLVEAMHFSKPVYAYDCIFNRFTTENGAFYFCNSQQLIRLLNDDSLNTCKNAQLMKQIAMSRYTWKTITSQYEELY